MAPNSTLAPPPVKEAEKQAEQKPGAPTRATESQPTSAGGQRHNWLEEALLENNPTARKRSALEIFFSLLIHTVFVSVLILLPLYFTEALDLKQFTATFLVAPPPPPPPPPPAVAQAIVKTPRVPVKLMQSGKLVAPTAIPKEVAMLKEEESAPDAGVGVMGGVPGGVPGGQAGGVIGGILSSTPKAYIPPAPSTASIKAPIRVGGRVTAPRPLFAPDPRYPPLAKQARVFGDVVIDAVIDTQGNVVEMQVVSGHPLLVPAALDALKQWKYQPTILNDQPVPVQLLVTIRFRLQ